MRLNCGIGPRRLVACLFMLGGMLMASSPSMAADEETARLERFADLALSCVHREFPNKIAHVLEGPEDAQRPRDLYPAFYGCYDWHSSVHGHWLLLRALRLGVSGEKAAVIEAALEQSFQADKIAVEVAYFEDNPGFERPYGVAWLLQLMAELREWDDPRAIAWRETLAPLEGVIVSHLKGWLPRLAYPIRLGTHNQSAFAFGLILDWARTAGDGTLEAAIVDKSRAFHLSDVDCPMAYEPSGEDFLSPCLMEADLMRRILTAEDFKAWFDRFMPGIPVDGSADWLALAVVLDPEDGKLVHLDGLNLSRAWNLEAIAHALGTDDPRHGSLMASAQAHAEAGLASVSSEHYSGGHWLGSFATYLVTRRWLRE